MNAPATKRCRKCGWTKPLTDFYPDHHCADGHRTERKTCKLQTNEENRQLKRAAGWVMA